MACDIEPCQLDGRAVFRVGRAPRPWSFTPWRYAEKGVFQGRWDDPEGEYRILYVSASAFGALVEVLADFRPDPALIAALEGLAAGRGACVIFVQADQGDGAGEVEAERDRADSPSEVVS